MKRNATFTTVVTALFAALICVSTMLVQIPIPATGGYANLGDGIILICAFLMQPFCAAIAAGIGSALADVLAGYVAFVPGTLLIKAGVALIAGYIFKRGAKPNASGSELVYMGAACIAAEAFMVLGYFFYEAVLLGVGMGAAGGIIGNIGQGAAGSIIACVAAPVFRRSDAVRSLVDGKGR